VFVVFGHTDKAILVEYLPSNVLICGSVTAWQVLGPSPSITSTC